MLYSGNAVGEVMYLEIKVWGPQQHVCESSHGNLLITYQMPSGKVETLDLIRDLSETNVFL